MIYHNDEISLIHGIKAKDNRIIQKLNLRALDGYDEDFLNQMETKNLPFPIKISYLLNRVISFSRNDHGDEKATINNIRNMAIGDRAYLAFLIRQLMYGNSIYFDVPCSLCDNTMSIHILINQVLAHSLSDQKKRLDVVVVDDVTGNYRLRFTDCVIEFRLLNGLDQEKLLLNNLNEIQLLQSCILNMDSIGPDILSDGRFVNLMNSALSQLDPLSDVILTQNCPSCHGSTKIPFIIEDFFFKEVRSRKNNLEFEVHWLALNYHWSESEILKLPILKRRRYVELINNTLGGEMTIG